MATQDRREVLSAGAGLAAEVALESGGELGEGVHAVKARGYWEQVWRRFRKDKVAIASGIFIILLFVAAFGGAPIAAKWLGHGPNEIYPTAGVDQETLVPAGPWHTGVDVEGNEVFFPLGGADTLGRDLFLRLLYGARVSLEVAIGATLISMVIGVILGATAGYFRGGIDAVISRFTEITMAFPQLLLIIALAATAGESLNDITFGIFPPGVFTLVLVLGVFGWFYPARIVRSQVLSQVLVQAVKHTVRRERPDQCAAVGPVRVERVADQRGRERREPVEAQVEALGGEFLEEPKERGRVAHGRRTEPQGAPVLEDDVEDLRIRCHGPHHAVPGRPRVP